MMKSFWKHCGKEYMRRHVLGLGKERQCVLPAMVQEKCLLVWCGLVWCHFSGWIRNLSSILISHVPFTVSVAAIRVIRQSGAL